MPGSQVSSLGVEDSRLYGKPLGGPQFCFALFFLAVEKPSFSIDHTMGVPSSKSVTTVLVCGGGFSFSPSETLGPMGQFCSPCSGSRLGPKPFFGSSKYCSSHVTWFHPSFSDHRWVSVCGLSLGKRVAGLIVGALSDWIRG